MRNTTLLLGLLLVFPLFASASTPSKKGKMGEVVYKSMYNGKVASETGRTHLVFRDEVARIWYEDPSVQYIPEAPQEQSFINYKERKTFQVTTLQDGSVISTINGFDRMPEFELTGKTEKIAGYTCKHAKASLFSNSYDLYYTDELPIKGSPYSRMGAQYGLVLKVVRNGSQVIEAEKVTIRRNKAKESLMPENVGETLDASAYRTRKNQSVVTKIDIFNQEQISWGNKWENADIESGETMHYAGGTVIVKKVRLPKKTDNYNVFAELTQYSNGDAYDRTGSVFVISTDKDISFLDALQKGAKELPIYTDAQGVEYQGVVATPEYAPVTELIRFFTPFGVRHFNERVHIEGLEWKDSILYKQDVTALKPLLEGEVYIGVFLGNYDKGGHKVNLSLKYYPGELTVEKVEPKKHFIMPIFNTLNVMEMAGQTYGTMFKDDSLTVNFEIPEGVKNLRLQYITTGHGGWGGGDEFNPKVNTIMLDGEVAFRFVPWRCDCMTHRESNPASGNFSNGLSSSDLSRSGWCPGTATNPVDVPLTDLKPGKHTMKVAIPLGAREGSSFSSWNVSGVLIGEME